MYLLLLCLAFVAPTHAAKKAPPAAPAVAPAPAAAPAATPIDPAFEADIRKMLELSGAARSGEQVLEMMVTQFQGMGLPIPAEFWQEFRADVRPGDLADLTVPIYARHLSHADIKELISFYESPIGRKLVSTQPVILQESMVAGQAWGQAIAEKLVKRMQERGYAPK